MNDHGASVLSVQVGRNPAYPPQSTSETKGVGTFAVALHIGKDVRHDN
jgi:hypothetical protein